MTNPTKEFISRHSFDFCFVIYVKAWVADMRPNSCGVRPLCHHELRMSSTNREGGNHELYLHKRWKCGSGKIFRKDWFQAVTTLLFEKSTSNTTRSVLSSSRTLKIEEVRSLWASFSMASSSCAGSPGCCLQFDRILQALLLRACSEFALFLFRDFIRGLSWAFDFPSCFSSPSHGEPPLLRLSHQASGPFHTSLRACPNIQAST